MLKYSAVRVTVVTDGCKKCRLISFREISSHRNSHRVAENDSRKKRQDHVAQKTVRPAADCQPLNASATDHPCNGIRKNEEQKYLRQHMGRP